MCFFCINPWKNWRMKSLTQLIVTIYLEYIKRFGNDGRKNRTCVSSFITLTFCSNRACSYGGYFTIFTLEFIGLSLLLSLLFKNLEWLMSRKWKADSIEGLLSKKQLEGLCSILISTAWRSIFFLSFILRVLIMPF